MINQIKKVICYLVPFYPGFLLGIPEVWIRQNDVPFVIGQWARYEQNTDMFEWLPFDSMRTWWDLTQYPGGLYARVHLLNPSQGIPPAPDTFPNAQIVELDTLGDNSVSWSYLSETQLYFYVQGIDFETGGYRFIGNYQPDYKCYAYPIYDGAGWITAWTWTYYLDGWLPYTANEQHQKTIVAKGKVKVPFSGIHYWPCLVIRDYMEYSDNFGTDDTRWIYEWVVPGRFGGGNGVAAAMSPNGASQNFVIVERFFKMAELYVPGWDVKGPEFSNTTVWPDTNFFGPYVVRSVITDSTGIGADSLFYNIDGGNFIGVGNDSVIGDTFYYTIPQVNQECVIGYFLWAEDSFCVANGVDLWHTDPICAPESTYYTFYVSGINESSRKLINETNFTVYPNPFCEKTHISYIAGHNAGVILRIYDVNGRLIRDFSRCTNYDLQPTGIVWDGKDNSGNDVQAGVYFILVSLSEKDDEIGEIRKVIKIK